MHASAKPPIHLIDTDYFVFEYQHVGGEWVILSWPRRVRFDHR